uniref:Prepilin-type N-terminal cleavage/methylation domain-containing protein n=1 Tax=candidate division CPR3 bacterium TaxID=2268181 RepID=A0A7C5UUZ5_UNCC3
MMFYKKSNKNIKKVYLLPAFSLLEMIVALGIFSILLGVSTSVLVRIMRIKMSVDAKSSVTDNLEYTIETMKRHLLAANASLVTGACNGSSSCTITVCPQNNNVCGEEKRFIYDSDKHELTFKKGDKEITLTSADVEVQGVVFQKVGNYVFMMLKATDKGNRAIPQNQAVVLQTSLVIRNE